MKKKLWLIAAIVVLGITAAVSFSGAAGNDGKTIKVGASPVPHAELLEQVKPILKEQGINLEIVEFEDYIQPNLVLNDKELDANFFQTEPYLRNFMEEHKECKLVNVAPIHIEPMGIYSRKIKSLTELVDGATISIPNDPINTGRALRLVESAGLIKLRDGVGDTATVQDITDNPKHLKFAEVEAAQTPRTLEDVAAAVINANYAIQVDLISGRDALFVEPNTSPYANFITVRIGDENRPEIKALVAALQSEKIKNFIAEKYKGAVVAAF